MRNRSPLFLPPPDAETQWEKFTQQIRQDYQAFFDATGPIVGARAPGRLDVMGGVADYSGSIVMELPISEAAFVAWQWREDRVLKIRSARAAMEGMAPEIVLSLDEFTDEDGYIRAAEEVKRSLNADPATRWASYVAGCFYVMLSAYGRVAQGKVDSRLGELGANILLDSDVPLGAGVSSSAAIEVATMHALSEAAGIHPSDMTLAAWCQRAENIIVGAPCGIMDQVTSALGRENALLVLKCQPHLLLGNQKIPPGWRFIGLDSRVKHSVGGSHYTKARIGAFMGLKIIQLESGGKLLENYLCQMSAAEFLEYRDLIPETLTGAEYHELYGRLPDVITRVNPAETYHPRACAEHPILENERVKEFAGLISLAMFRQEDRNLLDAIDSETDEDTGPDTQMMREIGALMYQSHASYSDRVDLGSPETDILVNLIRERGPEQGLYGAKITGGGSGGTVAVLTTDTAEADAALEAVCREYEARTGLAPRPIVGSSPGAVMFGARFIERG